MHKCSVCGGLHSAEPSRSVFLPRPTAIVDRSRYFGKPSLSRVWRVTPRCAAAPSRHSSRRSAAAVVPNGKRRFTFASCTLAPTEKEHGDGYVLFVFKGAFGDEGTGDMFIDKNVAKVSSMLCWLSFRDRGGPSDLQIRGAKAHSD